MKKGERVGKRGRGREVMVHWTLPYMGSNSMNGASWGMGGGESGSAERSEEQQENIDNK